MSTLEAAGFRASTLEDHPDVLLDMVVDVRRKLLGAELVAGLGKLDLGGRDLDDAKRIARRAAELIEQGVVGYTLIAATTFLVS